MSQVIVVSDNLKDKRLRSKQQEHKIDINGQFIRWRKNDISKLSVITWAIALAFVPLIVVWVFLMLAMSVTIAAVLFLFRGIGGLIRR